MLSKCKQAVVIGETKLCTQCIEYLLERGWNILYVVSDDEIVVNWAKDHSLVTIPIEQLSTVRAHNFYLFSIINPRIIPKAFLERKGLLLALNYHDSLLPKYAGVNSTTWAIFNNEKSHGVTLHQITSGIDEGGVAAQMAIAIEKNDTAFSLNLKCSENLLSLFAKVIEKLEAGKLTFTKQNIKEKTYYGLQSLPVNYGIVNGVKDLVELYRITRALSFGVGYDNPVATTKIFANGKFYLIEEFNQELLKDNAVVNNATILFNQVRDMYGNLIEQKITYQDLLTPYTLTAEEQQYLAILKAKERKAKQQILAGFDHADTTIKILESRIVNPEDKEHIEILTFSSQRETRTITALICLVLTRFFYRDNFIVSLYQSDATIPRNLLQLIDKRNFIYIDQKLLKHKLRHLENYCHKLLTTSFVLSKDFAYRYRLDLLTDIAIVVGAGITVNRHKIIITMENNAITIKGARCYQLQINSIAEAIKTLLDQDITQADLKKVNLLNPAQYQQIVYAWNQTDKPYPKNKTIHQLFEAQVKRTPNNVAVVYENTKLTYKELNAKANQLARYLSENYKTKPDDLVALCLDRTEYMIIAILAVLKAGGAYVPIDPSYPDERIDYILSDTNTKVVLTNDKYINKIEKLIKHKAENIDVVYMDSKEIQIKLAKQKNVNLTTLTKSSNLIYVIYTSGTTGSPKGVLIEHHTVVSCITYLIDCNKLNSKSVGSQYAGFGFDASVIEMYPILLSGGALHIVPKKDRINPVAINSFFHRHNVTYAFLPTKFAELFFDLENNSLMNLVVAGEKLEKFIKQSYRVYNGYGPTENTVYTTNFIIDKQYKNIPIGKPINNVKCYVVDNKLNILLIGSVGELMIGGENLARGYLNRPDLTAEKFISNPFQTPEEKLQSKNSRIYKTGDLVRWLPDGNLEYIGRNDSQVKISGYRTELGEIENKLAGYPGIKQAVVLAKNRLSGEISDKYLLAYYVSDDRLDESKIQAYLASQLPEYVIPNVFVHINKLPLTTNGKIDKKALPEPKLTNQSEYMPPRDDLEKNICKIYAQTLSLPIEQIGIRHDFFKMGGDSISSIQLVYRIGQKLALNISVTDIFTHRTVEQLVRNVLTNQNIHNNTRNIKQESNPTGKSGFLPIQEWFFDNVRNGSYKKYNYWNQSFVIKTPELDPEILKLSIKKLLQHHDAFRFRYKNFEQSYIEVDLVKELENIRYINISNLTDTEIRNKLIAIQSNFNIETGPIYVVAYLHGYKDKTARLFFAMHHLIVDSVSWKILTHDISRLYELLQDQENTNKTSQELLGQKGTSYRQWAEEVKNYKSSQELSYWDDVLKDYIHLPKSSDKESHDEFLLTPEITQKLLTKANEAYNTQVNDILLSALSRTLAQVFDRQVNHITLEGHGREEVNPKIDITKTMGWFTIMYPVKLINQPTISDLIKTTKENLKNIPNKGIGYGPIKGYKNLPNINFNYLGQISGTEDFWTIVDHIISADQQNQNNNILDIYGHVVNSRLMFHVSCNDRLLYSQQSGIPARRREVSAGSVFVSYMTQASDEANNAGNLSAKSIFDAKVFADKFKSNLEELIDHCSNKDITNHRIVEKDCGMSALLYQVKLSYAKNANKNKLDEQLQNKVDGYLKNAKTPQDLFSQKPITNVLLTGSTGFLGCNLLNQLLKLTDYKIFLLIRADSQTAAVNRINKKFQFYFDQTLDDVYEKRVFIIKSDLVENNLGLSAREYQDLSTKIDSIIHAAALVKHYGDYDNFYLQNVQSAINLLEFAKLTKLKDFHYISTRTILDKSCGSVCSICVEDDMPSSLEQDNVYLKTKLQGEYQTIRYRDYGIKSNIYRVGTLAFMAENLRTQENLEENGFLNWVKCLFKLQCVAKEISNVEVSPVDLTAKAIVKLFDKSSLSNKTYHVFNPYLFNISKIENSECKIRTLDIEKFIDRIIDEMKRGTNDNLIMKFLLYQGWLDNSCRKNMNAVKVLQDRTQYILEQLDFVWTKGAIKTFFNRYYKIK